MSRLTPFSLRVGTRLEIGGSRFLVSKCERMASTVELQLEGYAGPASTVSRNELATLVASEQARMLDDLEEPEPLGVRRRQWTDISHLSIPRMFDWHSKVYLLKALLPLEGRSPKSKVFRETLAQASAELSVWHAEMGTGYAPDWSAWTLYHDILRWRYAGHDMAALQKKGVEYSPWSKSRELYDLAREIAAEVLNKEPAVSAAGLHRQVNKGLDNLEMGP